MKPIEQLKHLYKKYSRSKREFNLSYPSYLGLHNAFDEVASLPNFEIQNLEILERNQKDSLLNLLTYLPQKAAVEELGTEVFVWACITCREDYHKDKFRRTLKKVIGMNPVSLFKAGNSVDCILSLEKTGLQTVLRNYDLIEDFDDFDISKINLAKILRENTLDGVNLSKERINDCSLEKLATVEDFGGYDNKYGNNKTEEVVYDVYLDSPLALVFLYKEKPNALISMFASSPKTLTIQQIQGINPEKLDKKTGLRSGIKIHARGLVALDWTKLLLDCTEQLAKKLNFEEIRVQSAYNNPWMRENAKDEQVTLTLKRGLKIYDKTARRAGFKKRKDKNWYKKLA